MKRILEVQKEIGTLSKNAKNPFFKSAYLDLNDLLTHVTPILNSKGLVLVQPIIGGGVCSQIRDSKDNDVIIESCIQLPELKDPQKLGSCITYFRRYTLKSLLAIAEGDDDGNLASAPVVKPNLTDKLLQDTLLNGSIDDLRALLNDYNCTGLQKKAITIRGKELANGK